MMWGRFKRLLMCSVLCITLTLETFTSSTSFADEAEDSKTEEPSGGSDIQKGNENEDGSYSYTTDNKEELQKKLDEIIQTIPEKKGSSIPLDSVLTCFLGLKEGGLNDYQAVGLTCNFIRETSLIPDVQPFVKTNAGIAGWGSPRIENLEKFSAAVKDTRYTVNGFTIGGLATQVAFAAAEATTGEKTGASADVDYVMTLKRAPFSRWLTNLDRDKVKEMTWDEDVDFTQGLTKELWDSLECPLACYLYAYVNFEIGEQGLDVMTRGGNQAQPLYELLTGISVEDANGMMEEDSANDLAQALVLGGLMDETAFVKWKVQTECSITFEGIMSLSEADIQDIESWKGDLEKGNSEGILIRGGRFVTILFGILFEVWMLLIYLAYWFDRLNNFIDFSLLSVLTMKHLRISPDESECTFSLTDIASSETRTVNHKKVLELCVIGLAFGTLIVSGAIFNVLSVLVNKVLVLLG